MVRLPFRSLTERKKGKRASINRDWFELVIVSLLVFFGQLLFCSIADCIGIEGNCKKIQRGSNLYNIKYKIQLNHAKDHLCSDKDIILIDQYYNGNQSNSQGSSANNLCKVRSKS